MDIRTLHKISYGLYIVTSKKEEKSNGQIANTVFQVTSEPPSIAVSISKENLTHQYIQDSKILTVSILSKETPLKFIGHFGFKSGKSWFIRNKVEKNLLRSLLIFNSKWLQALKLVKPHGLRIWERLTAQNSFKMDKYWAKKSAKPLLIRFCKSLLTIIFIKQGNISTMRFIST